MPLVEAESLRDRLKRPAGESLSVGAGSQRLWQPGALVSAAYAGLTVASFLNVLEYPPSLDFVLMTLGPALVALAMAERARGSIARWLAVYGRVPLFFYVVHIFVAHAAGVVLALVEGGSCGVSRSPPIPHPSRLDMDCRCPEFFLIWALVVIALYYFCRRFTRLKETRGDWWIHYL
jgi:hypothetical protein